jgi:hypothetical protein
MSVEADRAGDMLENPTSPQEGALPVDFRTRLVAPIGSLERRVGALAYSISPIE